MSSAHPLARLGQRTSNASQSGSGRAAPVRADLSCIGIVHCALQWVSGITLVLSLLPGLFESLVDMAGAAAMQPRCHPSLAWADSAHPT